MQDYISPNSQTISSLRASVQERLAVSLEHLLFDVFAAFNTGQISTQALKGTLDKECGFPSASVFALHGVLLKAALSQNVSKVPQAASALAGVLERSADRSTALQITPFGLPDLHNDDCWVLQDAFADDIGLTSDLRTPDESLVMGAQSLIFQAVDLLKAAAPDWYHEFILLADQLLLAESSSDTHWFVGAAVFDAFGAVLLNPAALTDLPSTVMALIHESSHQQMFLYHLDDPIVLNPAEEGYPSPLRKEPRPMEGIFHAMWVSARMALAANALLTHNAAAEWHQDLTQQKLQAIGAFRDCEATVAAHGDLCEFGKTLFENARSAVNAI